MSVTSLKLPEELKKRVAALAIGSGQSVHAFMVQAVAAEVERAELRRRFARDAAAAEAEAMKSGHAYRANEVFAYLRNRASGKRVKRPRAKSWR